MSDSTGPGALMAAPTPVYFSGVRVDVLGPIEVRVGETPVALGGPKQRALLALLVASAPRVVSTEALIEGLWGEAPSDGARSTLQTYISNLRGILGEVLVRNRGGYRIDLEPAALDAIVFEEALASARSRVATHPVETARSLRDALTLWRGRPYADLLDVPGLELTIRRLDELRLEAVEMRIDCELASGLHGELIAELEALAEEHPTREHFRAQHMLALYRSGRQAEALRAYRRTEEFLAEELGVFPSPELQDLELKILQHDDSLLAGSFGGVTQRLAFLVTDIEGSTRLWDSHPQEMPTALATHDRFLREAIDAEDGKVVKHTGDGVLATFPSAIDAVKAAETTLRALTTEDWGEIGDLRVRMGIDVGEAESRGGDFFGPPVNRAARLCSIGHGNQVLLSAAAQGELGASAPAGLQIRHLGEVRLRGMAAPEPVAQPVFVGLQGDFPDLRLDRGRGLEDRPELLSLPGYEVRDRIGEGGFGTVWRAYQPSVGREVAVKVIRPELASQASFLRRFEGEARTIARLAHPHIVPLIDFWRDTGSAYLVLGLLKGGSLSQALDSGEIDDRTARRILAQIGSALDYAHSQGIAHGDLKPANVLLDGAGNAYLADFGIASRMWNPDEVSSLSVDSPYRAPEVGLSGPTPLADIYSLGVLAGHLLDGQAAPELATILRRASAHMPGDRYQSAEAFLTELDRVLGPIDSEVSFPTVSRNPYKGLRSFDQADSADFFGRDELIDTLLAAIEVHRFVTVVGPSGSGKSSVVLAGLLPALGRGAIDGSAEWIRVHLVPGPDPIDALADSLQTVALRPIQIDEVGDGRLGSLVDGPLLIVIDQLEEIYTQVSSAEKRRQFIEVITDAIHDAANNVRVVATLRADFYDRPLGDPKLGALVRDGLVTVLPPTREELVEMITAPAQAVGLRWEPGLPHRIAEDVAHQPGGLPLLQYALTEMVERRSGDLLTSADYTRVGGTAGALATRAEALYQNLTPSQQESARQILLRLVTVDEDTTDTRRRVRRSELESIGIPRSDLDSVLDTLIAERLLLADHDPSTRGATVEVAHEALLREWPRLQGWVDDQREALILGRRFRAALGEWESNSREPDYLLTGSRLAPFIGWADTASLSSDEVDFYRSSRARDDQQRRARRRRRRTTTSILAGAAIVATILGILAAVQAQRATDEAERAFAAEALAESEAERASNEAVIAEDNARLARSRELSAAAEAALGSDPALAKLLALSALDIAGGEPTLDVRATLRQTLEADRVIGEYQFPPEREVAFFWADLHPSLPRLVAGGGELRPSSYLEVYDLERSQVIWSYETSHPDTVINRPTFSADGQFLVAGLNWITDDPDEPESPLGDRLGVVVFDAETGAVVDHFPVHPRCGGAVMAVSPTHIATASFAEETAQCGAMPGALLRLELVDLESKQRTLLAPSTLTPFVFFSRDGRVVAYSEIRDSGEEATVVLDTETGERLLEFSSEEHQGITAGWPQALNHDGSLLVAGDRPMAVWDVAEDKLVATFGGHDGEAIPVFAPSGETVFSIGRDGTLREWLALRGTEVASYQSVGTLGPLSARDDGWVLVVDQAGQVARVVNTGVAGEVDVIETCAGFTVAYTLDVSGQNAVVAELCPDGRWISSFISLEEGEVTRQIDSRSQTQSISPDGEVVVLQEPGDPLPGSDFPGLWVGSLWIRDLETGERVTELQGLCHWGFNGPSDHCQPYPETPFLFWAWKLVWSPDGRFLAGVNHSQGDSAAYVVVWEVASGAIVGDYACTEWGSGAIFSPDGSELIVSCSSGEIVAVDTTTWEPIPNRSSELDTSVQGRESVGFIGYGSDDETLVAVGGDAGGGVGEILWIDTVTLDPDVDPVEAFVGSPKSYAINPSRTLVAVGASDGFVKVFDIDSHALVDEFAREGQIQGLAFVTDNLLVVAPEAGHLYFHTLDMDRLVQLVRDSVRRGFTPLECERYGFEDDCPSPAELQGNVPLRSNRERFNEVLTEFLASVH